MTIRRNAPCILLIGTLLLSTGGHGVGAKPNKNKPEPDEKQKNDELVRQRIEEEKAIKALFGYSFNDIRDCLVIVAHDNGVGSGFIARMGDKHYILTNQHVIFGADRISFKTVSGKDLKPYGVELSATRDIARLELADEHAVLAISDNIEMEAPIGIFGNSEGAGVATELYGKITGIGADVVEVSAEFVSGNSGSPVLNLNREVVGIASYVKYSTPSKMKEGTRFENRTRRFSYRLAGSDWLPVQWKVYNEKYGKLYQTNEALITSIFQIISRWYDAPFDMVTVADHPDLDLRKWSSAHNLMVSRITRLSDKGQATVNELNNTNKLIRKDTSDSAKALADVCRKRARQMKLLSEQRELTEFLRKEFEGYANGLEFAAKQIDLFGDKLATIDYFHFKDQPSS